jgi:hypothetical protein
MVAVLLLQVLIVHLGHKEYNSWGDKLVKEPSFEIWANFNGINEGMTMASN